MDQRFRVFAVDDDWVILDVLNEQLSDSYALETFESVEACRARLSQVRPDLFLLDVGLPGISGTDFCRDLKDDWDLQDIPVMFISGNEDIETQILCYEAGGEDLIVKPFEPAVLRKKVQVAERIGAQKRALNEQAGYATRTAMSAMTSMGELGVVLEFLRKSFACETAPAVAAAMLDAMQQYDLQSAVQLRMGSEIYTVSPNGVDVPLEVGVLNHVRTSGRIFQFRSRCVFNYGRVTLLVNDMPVVDAEKCGRIRDNAALLAEGADARLQAIEAERASNRRRQGVTEILPQINDALESVRGNYRQNCLELTQVMLEYQESLVKSFTSLGLTDSQEETLSQNAAEFMERMVSTQDRSLAIVEQLEKVARSLDQLIRD